MIRTVVEGAPSALPLLARTVEIEDPGPLLALLPAGDQLTWVHRGDGLIGWGRAAEYAFTGRNRFLDAASQWREITRHCVVRDDIEVPGTGLVAFGTFTFDDSTARSRLIVPKVVVGRRDGRAWVTTIGTALGATPLITATDAPVPPEVVQFTEGTVGPDVWKQIVAEAVRRISAGGISKVVLARDVVAHLATPLDVRSPLGRLAVDYPGCWTFHVDGFFGSTPEMLVRLERGLVTSRVLAGTIRRTGDDTHDLVLAGSLARSSKDREEHEYAVQSVADALAPHCTSMNVPESPYVLHLPNVMHLATDVTGVIRHETSVLHLAASLHPSAAVGGTPTAEALKLIAGLERLDRGRYAGPVGWIGASGDGEWGIGLRSAQIEDAPDDADTSGGAESRSRTRVRLYAGCGIVADSVPTDELAEAEAKLVPIRTALGG